VSHRQERKEKDCLNCGALIQGRYCHICGQENVLAKESFGHLVTHFFYDITHFDSKFFDSLRYLIFRPGFLPKEYLKGRRVSYLNPIRMYVFTSAFFFIIFFSLFKAEDAINTGIDVPLNAKERLKEIKKAEEEIKKAEEELKKYGGSEQWQTALTILKDTSKPVTTNDLLKIVKDSLAITINNKKYRNLNQYDSIQHSLPAGEKDGWFSRTMVRKGLKFYEKNNYDVSLTTKNFFNTVFHKLPYLLFVSLPFFAFILKLLYLRRRKFYYEDHAIFSIYHYIFSFILLLFVFGFGKIQDFTGWNFMNFLTAILFLLGGFYLYRSMRRFYGQGRVKTLIKFLLLNLAGLISFIILFALFLLFSVFEL
jgi:Protein of unknown function (DUF3667)